MGKGLVFDEPEKTVKSYNKLVKDKEKFLSYDPRIRKISESNSTKIEKIYELASLIETEKILASERRVKGFLNELIVVADDVISQKKSLQK